MFKLTGVALIVTTFCSFALLSVSVFQQKRINGLEVENKILNGNLEAVEKMREDDQKRINGFAKQVTTVKKEREDLLIKMESIRNEEVDNFLDQSIPDELRDVIETYLRRERKAADN